METYEIVYNGTLEREWIRSQQRPAPPLVLPQLRTANPPRPRARDVVLAVLREHPGRVWSIGMLSQATHLKAGTVAESVARLRIARLVNFERIQIGPVRELRVWLLW